MRIEIEVPALPEGADGACLGKDLPEGAVATHYMTRSTDADVLWAPMEGTPYSWQLVSYTLRPYVQALGLPRPEPGFEWQAWKTTDDGDVVLHQTKKVTE